MSSEGVEFIREIPKEEFLCKEQKSRIITTLAYAAG